MYLDQGYDSAKDFIYKNISPLIETVLAEKSWIDAKSLFQERAQDIDGSTPLYKTLKETGPDHDKKFTVGVFIKEKMVATGDGKSKQDAEQEAAKKALEVKGWA
jgi:ribonuclease-3